MFGDKIAVIQGLDQLTGFHVREVQYGQRMNFVDSSEQYKLMI